MSANRPIPTDPGHYAIEHGSVLQSGILSTDGHWRITGWAGDASLARVQQAFARCTFARLEPVPVRVSVIGGSGAIATAKRRFDSIAGALLRLIFDDQNPSIDDAILLTTDRGNVEWLIALADVGFETEAARHLRSCPDEPGIEPLKNPDELDSEPAAVLERIPDDVYQRQQRVDIGKGLRAIRRAKELHYGDLARRTGWHPSRVSEIERSTMEPVTADELAKLMLALIPPKDVDSEPHVDDRRMVASLRDMEASEELLLKVADRLEELGRHDVILRIQRNRFDDQLRALQRSVSQAIIADGERERYGELGQIPAGLPIDGAKVWFHIPGEMDEAQPARLCDGDSAHERPYCVMLLQYGVGDPGRYLTDEQVNAAYFRVRVPVALPESADE